MPKLAANLSMLFTEVPFLDRFEAAARAGFTGVEYLFPYAHAARAVIRAMVVVSVAVGIAEQALFVYVVNPVPVLAGVESRASFLQRVGVHYADLAYLVALASHAALAMVLSHMGRTEDALEAAAQALRSKPVIPDEHVVDVGTAYAVAGHHEEARPPLQLYLSHYPKILPAHLTLTVIYSELGQAVEGQAEVAEVLRLNPKFSLEVHKQRTPIKDPAVLERYLAALRKAGLK